MQCALASLTLSRPLKRTLFPDSVNFLKKKQQKTDTIKEDRKNQTGNKMIYLQFFGPKLKRLIKHSSIYIKSYGLVIKSFVSHFARIDKSKGWKSSLELVEIQHVDIVIFCNTSPITSQLHVMT